MFAGYVIVCMHRDIDRGGIRLSVTRNLMCTPLFASGDFMVAAHGVRVETDDEMDALKAEIERLNKEFGEDEFPRVDRLTLIKCLDEVYQLARARPVIP